MRIHNCWPAKLLLNNIWFSVSSVLVYYRIIAVEDRNPQHFSKQCFQITFFKYSLSINNSNVANTKPWHMQFFQIITITNDVYMKSWNGYQHAFHAFPWKKYSTKFIYYVIRDVTFGSDMWNTTSVSYR